MSSTGGRGVTRRHDRGHRRRPGCRLRRRTRDRRGGPTGVTNGAGQRRDGEQRAYGRVHHEHHDATTTHSAFSPDARPPRYLTFPSSLPIRAPDPLVAFSSPTSCSSSCSLTLLLAAAPPPAFRYCLGCHARFICRSRKGGPARSGGPPFLESPGVMRTLEPEAGRRPVRFLRRTPRNEHLETNA
jgi:hypothetical protein